MKVPATILAAVITLTASCAWVDLARYDVESVPEPVAGTDQAIREFLTGRSLESIEGAWEHDYSAFELVIAKNTFGVAAGYDYVGIITRSDDPNWHRGDIKLFLNKTKDGKVFDGIWMTRNRARREMTFVVENRNLIQARFASTDGNWYFVRIRRIGPRFAQR